VIPLVKHEKKAVADEVKQRLAFESGCGRRTRVGQKDSNFISLETFLCKLHTDENSLHVNHTNTDVVPPKKRNLFDGRNHCFIWIFVSVAKKMTHEGIEPRIFRKRIYLVHTMWKIKILPGEKPLTFLIEPRGTSHRKRSNLEVQVT
jgi:hypothetical protein